MAVALLNRCLPKEQAWEVVHACKEWVLAFSRCSLVDQEVKGAAGASQVLPSNNSIWVARSRDAGEGTNSENQRTKMALNNKQDVASRKKKKMTISQTHSSEDSKMALGTLTVEEPDSSSKKSKTSKKH